VLRRVQVRVLVHLLPGTCIVLRVPVRVTTAAQVRNYRVVVQVNTIPDTCSNLMMTDELVNCLQYYQYLVKQHTTHIKIEN